MLNRVVLIGRLTKDPELKYTPSGTAVATFTLAIDSGFGEKKKTDFLNCVAWQKTAENTAEYLRKGSLAAVDGRVSTRNYEGKDGHKVYVTEITAERVVFLDSKKTEDKPSGPAGNEIDFNEDDIPF